MDKKKVQCFFFDALGVEYLAFIMAKCEEYDLVSEVAIGRCELPSITAKNKEFLQFFADGDWRKIDGLDEIKHHSQVYDYRKCEYPLHLFEELDVIDEQLRMIQSMLVQGTLEKALIVADHGASRLAVRYTVMSNHHLRNTGLSLKAKGLLSLMLSLPEEWDYTTKGLAHICKDGVDSICAGVRELEEHGYVIRERVRNENGQLGAIEYTILEQPVEPSPKREKWYPLMEWGWNREDCIREIEAAGLPQPGKSSCFFCPSMWAEEIIDLREQHPDLFRRAIALEDNARPNLKTVKGLGRKICSGPLIEIDDLYHLLVLLCHRYLHGHFCILSE